VSRFNEWLAANGKAREYATAMDEIVWLREERVRLRLTEAEREAIKGAIQCCEDITYGGPANQEAADVLNALLDRLK
jgi:hypothetical protein